MTKGNGVEVWEKINYLLTEKKISKKEFADRLVALTPKLKRTDEAPSSQTILGYLYGKREIKVELIPYIAEVLGVSEQDLFTFDLEYAQNYNYKQSKEVREILELLPYAPVSVVVHIKEQLQKYKKLYDESTKSF
ncbi:MAG: helix-turn-helix transcriptional regulator [Sulfurospirillum sp.]|jgi:transcriptional regulator with XRE-family HTH domain|nr:helix-turn-helix transcriptional regulator [Sulfurospirillum sp.]